eukprot:CAMPEP_0194345924 /NCGR_PEP_ID=MMETSP0171-20130528/105130_1 /TAXON_ID=218684 /ORGANISM="Corethron pennatum, Strain L29A3" /LENGTH=1502 /DNA_ID=CAMNT_0039112979 /DNA_START=45 /DNA_END=4552 /DNA_ORIENTATION=+
MKKLRLCNLLLFFVLSSSDLSAVNGEVNHGERLIEWLNSSGGYANPKLEIRRADPDDPTSHFGMYTKEKITKKELILDIPQHVIMRGGEDDEDSQDDEEGSFECGTARRLIKELRLGDDSEYGPFVNYLLEQPYGQLPSGWSDEGKELLTQLLENHTTDPIPPDEPTLWIDYEWVQECNGSTDPFEANAALMLVQRGWDSAMIPLYDMMSHRNGPFEANAALMLVQRGWDSAMIPLYDMMSHRNGEYLNTESNTVHDLSKNAKIRALRDIEAGWEIYGSYNMCKDCGGRKDTYGTPDILRDYGFVELYPQRWIFDAVSFEINEIDDGELEVTWIDEIDIVGLNYLQELDKAMKEASESTLKNVSGNIPSNELDTILQYHKSLSLAVSLALEASLEDDECNKDDETCEVSMKRYGDLTKDTEETDMEVEICDNKHFFEFEDYDDVEAIQSAYQLISTVVRQKDKDTCFDLDDTVQICSSYRPHYHEMVTHYTARFLPNIKRVLWVGGGDSMLLHEILKYPNLEIAVGLELDQHVTRMAFNTFGAQPHWDNEKVEWWYGDACKSLMMLPQDYFGSFDMVLVDLSETVMSFKVTAELDIMQALALLLKPDGIMVKNELYFPKMSEVFRHTTQIHYYDVPVICSQALSLGSPGTNFMQQPLTDHNIDYKNLFVEPLDLDEHMNTVHDYKYVSDNILNQCKQENETLGRVVPEIQEESPGITFIVEAENADAAFVSQPSKDILSQLRGVLSNEGLTVLSTVQPQAENADVVIVFILKEGYVVSKIHPLHKYVAFDMSLWSSFDKHKQIKDALVLAVGSSSSSDVVIVYILKEGYVVSKIHPMHKYVAFDMSLWSSFDKHKQIKDALVLAVGSSSSSSSSYRIVSGGMFGVNAWKDDKLKRGPHRTIACDGSDSSESSAIIDEGAKTDKNVIEAILEESMELVQDDDNLMIVLCGKESEQCNSFSPLLQMGNEHKVQRINSCPNINEYEENFAQSLHACEKQVLQEIRNFVEGSNGNKIKAIIFDSSMPYQMGQILFKIFSQLKNRFDLLGKFCSVPAYFEKQVLEEIRNFVDGSNGNKIKAIIFDSSMPYQMGQILFKIFSQLKNRFDLLPEDTAVISVSQNEKEEWRSNFINRFRKEIHVYEPTFKSDILFKSVDTTYKLSIVSRNEKFVKNVRELTSNIEKRTGLVSEVKDVVGGLFIYTPTYDFSKFYYPSDYDQTSPLEQWSSQKPLEQQTIFQLEENVAKSGLSSVIIKNALVSVLSSPNEKEEWRSNFINRFRKEIHVYEPTFKSDILFKSADTTYKLSIVSRNEKFVKYLRELTSKIEKRTGLVSEVKDVLGGMLIYTPTYKFSKFYYPKDYDQTSSLEQWSSQKPLEQQTIFQLEENVAKSRLSSVNIKNALTSVLSSPQIDPTDSVLQVEEFSDVGDGFVVVAFWSTGRIILVWDGRKHIDINLSTDAGNDDLADKFKDSILQQLTTVSVRLRDTQPRGIGRVVSYLKDMKIITSPIW